MKVLFLDFDGVLNSDLYVATLPPPSIGHDVWTALHLDDRAVRMLTEALLVVGAQVVVSSSWRCHHTLDELRVILEQRGLPQQLVIDVTPPRQRTRAAAIEEWLREHPETVTYAIVDDETLGWGPLHERVVMTDPSVGLHAADVARITALLAEPA